MDNSLRLLAGQAQARCSGEQAHLGCTCRSRCCTSWPCRALACQGSRCTAGQGQQGGGWKWALGGNGRRPARTQPWRFVCTAQGEAAITALWPSKGTAAAQGRIGASAGRQRAARLVPAHPARRTERIVLCAAQAHGAVAACASWVLGPGEGAACRGELALQVAGGGSGGGGMRERRGEQASRTRIREGRLKDA